MNTFKIKHFKDVLNKSFNANREEIKGLTVEPRSAKDKNTKQTEVKFRKTSSIL